MEPISSGLIVAFVVGLLILLAVLIKFLSISFKIAWKIVVNSIAGAIMLWIVNLFGAAVNINFVSAFIAGVFGIPGVIIILLYTYL